MNLGTINQGCIPMKDFTRINCLNGREFVSYMIGTVYGREKLNIEQHLNHCDTCFEAFISSFNQYLDQDVMLPAGMPASQRELQYHYA